MEANIEKIINKLSLRPGASENEVKRAQLNLKVIFPDEYKDFCMRSNGVDGVIGKSYLVLWPLGEIEKLNKSYSVEQFAPGLLLFGSDGGDMAYAFDARLPALPIVEVPFIGMSLKEIRICGSTFYRFLEYLYNKK